MIYECFMRISKYGFKLDDISITMQRYCEIKYSASLKIKLFDLHLLFLFKYFESNFEISKIKIFKKILLYFIFLLKKYEKRILLNKFIL